MVFDPKVATHEQMWPTIPSTARPETRDIVPDGTPVDCALDERHTVRLKLGAGAGMPYGWCGGDPPLFASIWIDHVKVVSAKDYAGRCMQEKHPLSHVKVTAKGVRWCTARARQGSPPDPTRLECSDIRATQGAHAKDIAEFPPAGSLRPQPGTILIDHATDRVLCAAMARREPSNSSPRAFPLPPPPGSEVELLAPVPLDASAVSFVYRGRFDLDNDGAPEDVLMLRSLSGAQDADQLLGAPDHALPPAFDETSLEQLAAGSRVRIPAAWATGKTQFGGEHYDIKNLHAERRPSAQAGSALSRHTRLRLQYLHLEPFRYEGKTYLLSSPPDWSIEGEDTFVLFRPRPAGFPDEVCIFHQVQENF